VDEVEVELVGDAVCGGEVDDGDGRVAGEYPDPGHADPLVLLGGVACGGWEQACARTPAVAFLIALAGARSSDQARKPGMKAATERPAPAVLTGWSG
jgi:hypothetical protein